VQPATCTGGSRDQRAAEFSDSTSTTDAAPVKAFTAARIDRSARGLVGLTALMFATRARTSGGKVSSYDNGATDLNLRVR
jgi:hypothetical protein